MKAMKLKYILGAVLSAFIFAGCSDDDEVVGTFGDINVSQSYLSIPETGGSTKVTVRSAADWKFGEVFQTITKNSDGSRDTTYNALPAWLSADVLSGGAGETVVTFSADATNGGREAELQIVSGEHTQFIKVRQGEMTPVKATIAEILAAPAGKSYRVTGVVTRYYGNYEQYGNYYIKDATGEILVYGTADKDGKLKNYPMKSWGIEIGDEITIEGATSEYKGVNQFVDVTVVSLKKGLLQVVGEAANVSKEGGNIEVKMGYKGNGAYFSIPEDVDWIKYLDSKYIAGGDADTIIYSFSVAPNEGGAREAQITFTSSKGKDKSEINYTVKQEAGAETPVTPPTPADDAVKISVADFNAAAESTDVWYMLTGTVTNLKDGDIYGNFDLVDETGSVYVYGLLSEKGGEKKKFQELVAAQGIKEGTKITIIGNRGSYNGKFEVTNAYFVCIGEAEGGNTGGDEPAPSDGATVISVVDFNAAAESTDVWYKLTGTISNLKDGDLYGNFDLTDATGSVYVYGVLSEKGGEKKKFQDLVTAHGIKNGTTITIIGNRGSYNGKIEVTNAYFVSASN